MGWSLLNFCHAVVSVFAPCRRVEELLDHLCPWARQDNIIQHSTVQWPLLLPGWGGACGLFFKSKSISPTHGFCLLLKIIICQPWWPFFQHCTSVVTLLRKPFGKAEGTSAALWHSCSSWISPPLVGPLQRKRVNGEVSAYFAAQESTVLNWLSHEPASSPSL